MSTQPEATELAEVLESYRMPSMDVRVLAAAELRRQHEEITELRHGAGVAHQTIAGLVAQRDALLEALRYWLPDETMIPAGHEAKWYESVAAIKAVEEGK